MGEEVVKELCQGRCWQVKGEEETMAETDGLVGLRGNTMRCVYIDDPSSSNASIVVRRSVIPSSVPIRQYQVYRSPSCGRAPFAL